MTLPPEMQLICAEKLSLQRVRDSMGSTLEPALGLLRYNVCDPQTISHSKFLQSPEKCFATCESIIFIYSRAARHLSIFLDPR